MVELNVKWIITVHPIVEVLYFSLDQSVGSMNWQTAMAILLHPTHRLYDQKTKRSVQVSVRTSDELVDKLNLSQRKNPYCIWWFSSVTFSMWLSVAVSELIRVSVPQRPQRVSGRHDGGGRALRQHRGGGDGGREFHPVPGGEAFMGWSAEDHPQQPQEHRRGHQQGTTRLPVRPEGRGQSAFPPDLLPRWAQGA